MPPLAQALLLSLSSSLDNLAVGLSLGVASLALPWSTVLIVAGANSAGMLGAAAAGALAGARAPRLGAAAAALVFLGLGAAELASLRRQPGSALSPLAALHRRPWALALPMTLNNLAGGVGAGLARAPRAATAACTFAASAALMAGGHRAGAALVARGRAGRAGGLGGADRAVAGGVFAVLGLQQLRDALAATTSSGAAATG